jgi:hypothetical protein
MKTAFTLMFLTLLLLSGSCEKEKKKDLNLEAPVHEEAPSTENPDAKPKGEENEIAQDEFVPQSTDQQTADNLRNFLKSYTANDYEYLTDLDRRFQFFKVDLNGDGNEEIFVRFMGPYFCGTGGCTFLLLDKYGEVITRFTVTRAPIFIETKKVNGWSLLLVKDSGVFKELIFENGSYPDNPSVLPKAPYDAPSGHAMVMFDEEFAKSKTFTY